MSDIDKDKVSKLMKNHEDHGDSDLRDLDN